MGWCRKNPGQTFDDAFDLSKPEDIKVWEHYNKEAEEAIEVDEQGLYLFNPTTFAEGDSADHPIEINLSQPTNISTPSQPISNWSTTTTASMC